MGAWRSTGILLTKRCNYQCRHCYLSCHSGAASQNIEQVKKIIDHFPENVTNIYLSGGEPFVEKKLLYDVLTYLSSRRFPALGGIITVRTNGFWGCNEAVARRIIDELLGLNLKFTVRLYMAYDAFHKEQGLKLDYLIRIREMVDRVSEKKKGLLANFYKNINTVNPVGRAVSRVPRKQWHKEYGCIVFLKPNFYDLVVDCNGVVHACCWLVPPVLGNAVNDPITEILKKATSDKIYQLLEEKGVKGVASFLGWPKEAVEKEIIEGGECWLCSKIFSKIKKSE